MKQAQRIEISKGKYYPLGATPCEDGVNFAIYSQFATDVFLLLFDAGREEPRNVIRLENRTRFIWHAFVHNIGPGQLYGYKIKGPYEPRSGFRFNENKLLLDPYAKAVTGKARNIDNLLLSYDPDSPEKDLSFDSRDSTPIMPRSIVIDDAFDWQGDRHPDIPIELTVIYEAHPRGFTAHKSSGVKHPGTYLGFIEKIPYLKDLGITAVELMPVQEFYVEDFLEKKGLTNYWGYNTIGFFAPECSYSTMSEPGCQVPEFKTLVRELHKAGIEVILDVVYNHTGEGSELGPTICFRGVDNFTYYILGGDGDQPFRYYMNYTGCGNSVDACNSQVIRLIADSLRYWVEVMHVDGFRFDLATVLGRRGDSFSPRSTFFDVISQDPVLSKVKLIAEPWDIGTYQVGNFPVDWCEWNGKFRDTVRRFNKGDAGQTGDLARRISGSSDIYGDDGRSAYNSVNFITCHDGFTLYDLVSYNYKHNEANLEENRDGSNDNNSWNSGEEGETSNREILALRRQLARNLFLILMTSMGTPMILGGDEFLRTKRGNNNTYCQDNELTWLDWNLTRENSDFLDFCRNIIHMTDAYKAMQVTKYFKGRPITHLEQFDADWFGKELGQPEWNNPEERTLSLLLHAREKGGFEYYILFIFNGDYRTQTVELPELPLPFRWGRKVDTSLKPGEDFKKLGEEPEVIPADCYIASPRSVVILLAIKEPGKKQPRKR